MNKIIISLIMLLLSNTTVFSQKTLSEIEIKKLEEYAINKMRKTFDISKETELFATMVFEVIDSTKIFAENPTFDINNRIGNYLQNSKVIHYEIFVYDSELKNVYVINRIFLGCGKFKKKYYLGKNNDFIISKFFLANKYNYVLNIADASPLVSTLCLLCFQKRKIDLAYLENENIKSVSVCFNDTFDFLGQ